MTTPHAIHPKKHFGQHFLVHQGIIQRIVQAGLASPAERILEIGPGPAVLTAPLLEDGRPLWAVELDPEACAFLSQRFADTAHFHLIQGDAVHVALPPGGPWVIVGNLPYNAATAILTRFLVGDIPWERMVLMFQLEVGQKLMGQPGEKNYGPLSILAQLCCRMTHIMKLGPEAFSPPPKVDSIVLLFQPREDALPLDRRKAMLDLLHRSFAMRRKTLANNWKGWLEPDRISSILEAEKLPAAVRAEAVPMESWIRLLEAVSTPQ